MNNGLASFDNLIAAVQDETGITNLRNHLPMVRRLVNRAENEINPYGTLLIKKKMIHYVGNGTFDGRSIKKPEDFVSIDEVGCCEDGLCKGSYYETVSHIVLCDGKKRTKIVWTYWAMQHDGNGNPIISINHIEALVAFITLKLYSQRMFINKGNANLFVEYKREWENRCMESRGEDFMPGTDQLDWVFQVNKWASLHFENYTTYDRCLSCHSCLITEEEPMEPQIGTNVYYWQLTNTSDKIQQVIPLINTSFFDTVPFQNITTFESGYIVSYSAIGRICFAIRESNLALYSISDSLDNDVTDEFEKVYLPEHKTILFVSKNYYSHSNIYFKFKKMVDLSNTILPNENVVDLGLFNNLFTNTFN